MSDKTHLGNLTEQVGTGRGRPRLIELMVLVANRRRSDFMAFDVSSSVPCSETVVIHSKILGASSYKFCHSAGSPHTHRTTNIEVFPGASKGDEPKLSKSRAGLAPPQPTSSAHLKLATNGWFPTLGRAWCNL